MWSRTGLGFGVQQSAPFYLESVTHQLNATVQVIVVFLGLLTVEQGTPALWESCQN